MKGATAQHAWLYWSHRGPDLTKDGFGLRKQRKKLARAAELVRLLATKPDDPATPTLHAKLGLAQATAQEARDLAARLRAEVAHEADRQQRARVSTWRHRMVTEPRALGAWLKSKQNPVAYTLRRLDPPSLKGLLLFSNTGASFGTSAVRSSVSRKERLAPMAGRGMKSSTGARA